MNTTEAPVHSYAAAGGVVVDPTGELVLVLIRAKRLLPNGQPEIRLPKGHIEAGESPRDAALREVHEESGLNNLEVVSDLGNQHVSFTFEGMRCLRDESYFLMTVPTDARHVHPEGQFERLWLAWKDALTKLTFEAEQEWIRRARIAWNRRLQDISDQDAEQSDGDTQVEQ
jgi:ADP-ribose pyrophosphatase YjhB (NUDIX family)